MKLDPSHAPDLAVVIPAWNERADLDLLLPALQEVIASLDLRADIVVVDGGVSGRDTCGSRAVGGAGRPPAGARLRRGTPQVMGHPTEHALLVRCP